MELWLHLQQEWKTIQKEVGKKVQSQLPKDYGGQ